MQKKEKKLKILTKFNLKAGIGTQILITVMYQKYSTPTTARLALLLNI